MFNCPVCHQKIAQHVGSAAAGLIELECRRCGHFKVSEFSAVDKLRKAGPEKRALVCSWLWDQNAFGSVPTIDEHNIDALLSLPPLPFFEKAKRLLIHCSEKTKRLGQALDFSSPRLDAMLATIDHDDVDFVRIFLTERRWMEKLPGGAGRDCVSASGLRQADEWKESASISSQAFVAMSFDPTMTAAWENGLQKGISAAGYKPLRIDKTEHINKICDEVIAQIRRSRFLIADYTGHRPNVYYEAGYAGGRGLPVFLTCRKDAMADRHFDIRQYNCIDWETPDELAKRLQDRIEAVVGDGPLKPTTTSAPST
jgi:nucleoside 2-deoxyribosyltransferase